MTTWTPWTPHRQRGEVVPLHEARSLSADDCTVSTARHFVVDTLRACAWDEDSVGVVALLTSELASNAVMHAQSPYSVTIDLTERVVRVEVVDESTNRPVPSTSVTRDEGGRGLFFLEVMADTWGVDAREDGKSVWFELGRA